MHAFIKLFLEYIRATPNKTITSTYVAAYMHSDFFSLVIMTLLLCSFIFTFPTYIVLRIKAEVLTTEQIKKNRKYLYVGAVVLIAILDPESSLITEVTTIIPYIIFTEIAILIARHFEKKRKS